MDERESPWVAKDSHRALPALSFSMHLLASTDTGRVSGKDTSSTEGQHGNGGVVALGLVKHHYATKQTNDTGAAYLFRFG